MSYENKVYKSQFYCLKFLMLQGNIKCVQNSNFLNYVELGIFWSE